MVIAQIVLLGFWQVIPVIPAAPVPNPILTMHEEEEDHGRHAAQPHKSQAHAVAQVVSRGLAHQEDIRGNHARAIADGQLDGGADPALVVAAQVVVEPHDGDGLGEPAATGDQVDGKVPSPDGDVEHGEEHGVADGAREAADDDEAESVAQPVGQDRRRECHHHSCHVDRDAHHLGTQACPAQLAKDGRDEERGCVRRSHDA